MFVWDLASIALALLMLFLGEMMKNETKEEYERRGYSWRAVLSLSALSGLAGGGSMIVILNYIHVDPVWNPQFLPFAATIVSYVTIQSFMTDFRVLLINRKLLRVAYLSMYAVSLYNVTTNSYLKSNWIALLLFTVLLMLIFLLSSIGASDVRAIAVALPYVISIGGYNAIIMFTITLLIVALGMGVRNIIRDWSRIGKFKRDNKETYEKMNKVFFYLFARKLVRGEKSDEELGTPVGPYMITPFLVYLFIFPFITS